MTQRIGRALRSDIGRWTFPITEDTEHTEHTECHLFTDNLDPDLVKKWFSLTKNMDKCKDGILHRILDIELHPVKTMIKKERGKNA